MASGKLLRIEHGGPGGLEVLIQHDGYVSVSSHLASVAPSLEKGTILAGDEVGIVGHTGVSFGPHLFFALLEGGRAVDPRSFLGVPFCNGNAVYNRTPAGILDASGKLLPTRHYFLLSDFPASHHSQARNGLVDRFCTTAVALPTTGDPGLNRVSCTMAKLVRRTGQDRNSFGGVDGRWVCYAVARIGWAEGKITHAGSHKARRRSDDGEPLL